MIKNLIVALLALCYYPAICQTQTTDSIINIATPDSIFWVDNLEKFAEDNELFFIEDNIYEDEKLKNQDIYLLGNMARYSIGFVNNEAYIAVKDGNRFRLWNFAPFTTQFTNIRQMGIVTINNKKLLQCATNFYTSWSMFSPDAGRHFEQYETLVLFDTAKNEMVFNITFNYFTKRIKDEAKFERYMNEEGFEFDNSLDYEYEWYNYLYNITSKKIEFYISSDKRDYEQTPDKNTELNQKQIKGKKPDFYYEFDKKGRKWVLKPNKK